MPEEDPRDVVDTRTATVRAISRLQFVGNIVPHTWYRHITKKGRTGQTRGKPDLVAIAILADTVYWFRGTDSQDADGRTVLRNKLKGVDWLKRGPAYFAKKFGITVKDARQGIARLEELRLLEVRRTSGKYPELRPVPEIVEASLNPSPGVSLSDVEYDPGDSLEAPNPSPGDRPTLPPGEDNGELQGESVQESTPPRKRGGTKPLAHSTESQHSTRFLNKLHKEGSSLGATEEIRRMLKQVEAEDEAFRTWRALGQHLAKDSKTFRKLKKSFTSFDAKARAAMDALIENEYDPKHFTDWLLEQINEAGFGFTWGLYTSAYYLTSYGQNGATTKVNPSDLTRAVAAGGESDPWGLGE